MDSDHSSTTEGRNTNGGWVHDEAAARVERVVAKLAMLTRALFALAQDLQRQERQRQQPQSAEAS